MPPLLESPIETIEVSSLSPSVAILMSVSCAALIACSAGAIACYIFASALAKEEANRAEESRRRSNTMVTASKYFGDGLDAEAASRAIEDIRNGSRGAMDKDCELGLGCAGTDSEEKYSSKIPAEDAMELQRINERLRKRLRRHFTRRARPHQWNLPAIMELAEAASCATAGPDNPADETGARRSTGDSGGKSSRQTKGRLAFPRLVGVVKHPSTSRHRLMRKQFRHQRQQHLLQLEGRRAFRRSRTNQLTLQPAQLAEALANSHIRRPSWPPSNSSTPTPMPRLTASSETPKSKATDDASKIVNDQPVSTQQTSSRCPDRKRQLKLMLRLSQDAPSASSSCGGANNSEKEHQKVSSPNRHSSPSTSHGVVHEVSTSNSDGGNSASRKGDNNSSKLDVTGDSALTMSTASGTASDSADG